MFTTGRGCAAVARRSVCAVAYVVARMNQPLYTHIRVSFLLLSSSPLPQHEANVLGIANITGLGDIANIIVHGADFYENLYAFIQNLEKHDYRAAGQEAGNVLNQLSQWTSKHACTSDLCYVVTGVIEFMGDIQGSIKTCEKDFTTMWGNFTAAFHDFTDEKSIVWEFEHDIPKVRFIPRTFTK